MEIKVKVEIGASQELRTILENFLQVFGGAAKADPKSEAAPEPKEEKVETVREEAKAEQTPEKDEKPKKYTEVDVRAAIDACRKRFCGEDYKNNADTPEYKKYNKPLLAWFKEQAGILGAEDSKPSNLPAESRAKFIEICESTILDDKDNFICKCPF